MAEDYYQLLGVERSSSAEEIKKAYRKLAHQYHPDKKAGNEEQFKKINEAYQVLGNKEKRAQYDQFGSTFEGGNPFGGAWGGQGVNVEDFDFGNIGDIFSDFFGGRSGGPARRTGGRSRTRRGQDIAMDLTIDFVESARGVEQDITHTLYQTCSHCHGNGAEPGTPIKDCPRCGGQGRVNTTQQTMFGVFSSATVCPECRGQGKKPATPCKTCRGEGRERTKRTLGITIPGGIADGQTIRLTGKGEAPPYGGSPGDLYVRVHVRPLAGTIREGDNVRSTVTVSFVEAALGTTAPVTTLEGKEFVSVPAGTQPGNEVKLTGKGFPSLQGNSRGDHIVTVKVEIPKKLSRQQKELLEQFRSSKKKGLFF